MPKSIPLLCYIHPGSTGMAVCLPNIYCLVGTLSLLLLYWGHEGNLLLQSWGFQRTKVLLQNSSLFCCHLYCPYLADLRPYYVLFCSGTRFLSNRLCLLDWIHSSDCVTNNLSLWQTTRRWRSYFGRNITCRNCFCSAHKPATWQQESSSLLFLFHSHSVLLSLVCFRPSSHFGDWHKSKRNKRSVSGARSSLFKQFWSSKSWAKSSDKRPVSRVESTMEVKVLPARRKRAPNSKISLVNH